MFGKTDELSFYFSSLISFYFFSLHLISTARLLQAACAPPLAGFHPAPPRVALATTTTSVRTTRPLSPYCPFEGPVSASGPLLHPASRPLHARVCSFPHRHSSLSSEAGSAQNNSNRWFLRNFSHKAVWRRAFGVLILAYCNCNYVLYGLWFGMTSSLSLLCMTF